MRRKEEIISIEGNKLLASQKYQMRCWSPATWLRYSHRLQNVNTLN